MLGEASCLASIESRVNPPLVSVIGVVLGWVVTLLVLFRSFRVLSREWLLVAPRINMEDIRALLHEIEDDLPVDVVNQVLDLLKHNGIQVRPCMCSIVSGIVYFLYLP